MKKLILLSITLSFSCLTAQNRQITFETGNWASVLEKAKKENKLIFIDAYTTWCGPCKMMAKTVFTNDSVADYFNSKFVNYKMDMEKGEGLNFAKVYEVNCYPNLLLIDGNGNIVHRSAGFLEASVFLSFARESFIPEKTFTGQKNNLEKNGINEKNIKTYIDLLQSACFDPATKVTAYLSTLKEEELTAPNNWEMLSEYNNDYKSREIAYFLKNSSVFENKFGKEAVSNKIVRLGKKYFEPYTRAKTYDASAYEKAKSELLAMKWPNIDKIFFDADLSVNKRFNKEEYYKLASKDLLKYSGNDAQLLNSTAWDFYEHVTDAEQLKSAVAMAKKACEMKEYYPFLDTYASVLFKSGNYTEADALAKKAIEVAKKMKMSEDEYKETIALQKQIKAKLNSK